MSKNNFDNYHFVAYPFASTQEELTNVEIHHNFATKIQKALQAEGDLYDVGPLHSFTGYFP